MREKAYRCVLVTLGFVTPAIAGCVDGGRSSDDGNSGSHPDGGTGAMGRGTCGNGVVEANEQCDGTDLAGQTCASIMNASSGRLACDERCRYDTSQCVAVRGGAEAGSAGPPRTDGGAGTAGGASGTGGEVPDAGGASGGGTSDAGGATGDRDASGGGTSDAGGASGGGTSDAGNSLDALRQFCVDYINMYRTMRGLDPLARAGEEQEHCSDRGAQMDAESGQAHGSAGSCPGLSGGQNTCPEVRVGGLYGTLQESLTQCIDEMWAEGQPPVPRNQCIQDSQGCLLEHGHYLNMTDSRYNVVSCGFYEKPDGSYWINQDFGF